MEYTGEAYAYPPNWKPEKIWPVKLKGAAASSSRGAGLARAAVAGRDVIDSRGRRPHRRGAGAGAVAARSSCRAEPRSQRDIGVEAIITAYPSALASRALPGLDCAPLVEKALHSNQHAVTSAHCCERDINGGRIG